jgi:hypothetical protein
VRRLEKSRIKPNGLRVPLIELNPVLLRVALQEATDIYKGLLLDHRELLALNMYVALCYSKLDYYDVSQEILQVRVVCHDM